MVKQFRNGADVFGDGLIGGIINPNFSAAGFLPTPINVDGNNTLPMAGHPLVYDYQTNGLNTNLNIIINFDNTNIDYYSLYGSLAERLRSSVNNIINNFPAALYYNELIYNYTYSSDTNTCSFQIPTNRVYNPYNISITTDALLNTSISGNTLRNLVVNYSKFIVDYSGSENPILSLTTDNTYLTIMLNGNVFTGSGLYNIFIKPNFLEREQVFDRFDEIENYLLTRETTPIYSPTFKTLKYDNDFLVNDEKVITWETYFYGYNPNINLNYLTQYINSLVEVGNSLDSIKSNLIARFYVSDSIIDFDTPDQKMQKMLQIYGRSFDEIKKFIDGLAFANNVSYNKKNNAADQLIKNLAETIGWKADTIYGANDLLTNVFGVNETQVLTNRRNLTPNELDIEFWRRLFMNSAYLFRSKGTRKALEFILEYFGAPESLYEFNEYVYLADGKIALSELESVISLTEIQTGIPFNITTIPVDSEGYPYILPNSNDFYFQMKNYKEYFEKFPGLNYGYEITQETDNRKSWFVSGSTDVIKQDFSESRYANYMVNDERLVLNNKYVDINLKLSKPIENDVYNFYYTIQSGNTWFNTYMNDTPQSLRHFLDEVYSRLINVRNRKGINSYPTLYKVYEDYLTNSGTTQMRYIHILKYLDSIGDYWVNLVKQFVPATTITFVGEKIANTVFHTQKYEYKRGVNEGSEFASNNINGTLL